MRPTYVESFLSLLDQLIVILVIFGPIFSLRIGPHFIIRILAILYKVFKVFAADCSQCFLDQIITSLPGFLLFGLELAILRFILLFVLCLMSWIILPSLAMHTGKLLIGTFIILIIVREVLP